MKLSICVITMNRAEQLREALESCLKCELPKQTEFVVIDNASTDNTADVVREVLDNSGYRYYYEKLTENIGAGAGRNCYFEKAEGDYVYGMDDDAFIDFNKNPDFFVKAIDLMEKNQNIGSLATQVFDMAWNANRQEIRGPQVQTGLYKCKMFCGGSHFLRKSLFVKPPYFPNKYGYEELLPSLKIVNVGKMNVFCPDIVVIHNPKIDKWNACSDEAQELKIKDVAIPYAIKSMMYPFVFRPLLWVAKEARYRRVLTKIPEARKRMKNEIKEMYMNYKINEKIGFFTVLRLVIDFGLSAF